MYEDQGYTVETTYDGVAITGEAVKDTICLSSVQASCTSDYIWLNVQNDGLGSSISGVVGLTLDPTESYGYVPTLYSDGAIDYPYFSISLSN